MTGRHRLSTQHARTIIITVLVVAVAYLLWSKVNATYDANEAAGRADTAQAKADAVANPVDALCAKGDDVAKVLAQRGACSAASAVREQPHQPRDGINGVGIRDVNPGECSVEIVLDDSRRYILGDLCGQPGKPAEPGRGIASTTQDGCYVTVSYTDNAPPARLGPFCGPPGETGAKGDKGDPPPCMAEPAQCRGEDGKPGKPPAGWSWTDVDGREQSCTRDNTDDTAPYYACTAPPPATTSTRATTTAPPPAPLLPPS